MFKKATTAESGTSASSRSQAEKPIRRLSPVAFLASAAAALLTAGIVAGPLVSVAEAAPSPQVTSHALATTGLGYTALSSPVRIADTRSGATDPATYAGKTLAEGTSLTVDVPTADIPSNASAVVVNVTAIDPAGAGYLSVYPGGSTNPGTANVTFTAGQIVGNLVTVGLGPDSSSSSTQSFTVYNGPSSNNGPVDFTADLEGYYSPATATSGGTYVGLNPARLYDSRTGSGEPGAGTTLAAGGTDNVPVLGVGGVPASATAVVLNVAVTNTTASGYISAYPTGSAPTVPTASQNFVAGETLSSQVVSGVGTGGDVTIANYAGTADIVVDVDGYFTAPGGSGSLLTVLSSPVRLLDTRPTGVAAGSSASATVQGTGATAGVVSIADLAQGGNYLTAYAAGGTAPLAANVNYSVGDTYNIVENSAYTTTATGGGISILNGPSNGNPANIVVDEFGYFAPAAATATAYTVTPSTPQNVPPSETGTPTAGAITYTVTGQGTTPIDVELFAGSNVTAASGGGFTFTNNGTVATQGTVGATITAINGAAITPTTQVNAVPSVAGSATFTINSSSLESDWPVVFADDAGHTLPVNASGGPTAAYGVGGEATWTAPAATPGDYDVYVQTVNAAANTFVGCSSPVADSADCYTFSLTPGAGATNTYEYASPFESTYFSVTQAQFLSYLSGSTPAYGTDATRQVDGDFVDVTVGTSPAPSDFENYLDVPNAPTAVVGTEPLPSPFETVSFTAPINAAAPANDVEGYLIYAAPEVGSGSSATYTFPTSVPNGDPTIPTGDFAINDATGTNPFNTFGVCSPVTSVCENAFGGLPTGTYEFEVQAYNAAGFNSPLSAPSAPLAVTATPIAPVSTESVLTQGTNAGNGLQTLDTGDTLQFIFANTSAANPLTVATNASVTLVDSYGAEVSLTNGSNATFTVSGSGTTLTIAVTGAPALVSPATPGNASPNPTLLTTFHSGGNANVDAVLSDTGISTTNGPWNLAVSGLHSPPAPYSTVTRIFDSGDTAGAATTVSNNNGLPGTFSGTITETAPNTVVVDDNAGGNNAATGDPLTVYNAQGGVIGSGTYSSTANTTITTTASFLPGATLYVVYQDTSGHAGVFHFGGNGPSNQPSSSYTAVVPGTPVVTSVTGAGKTLSVTWGTSVTELLGASNYTVSDDDCDSAVATGTNVTPSPGTTVTLTLDTALTNDSSYELCVNPATVEDSSSQVNVTQDFSFTTQPDTINVVTGPDVSSSSSTTNTDPTWTGTATTAGTATESSIEADFNNEGFSTAGVSITSGSGTNNVAWTYTPTTGEGAPLNNGSYSLRFEVIDNASSSAESGTVHFTETGGVAATDTIVVTTGPAVNSPATTSNPQPAFGGTATTGSAHTISTGDVSADLDGGGFSTSGVSIVSGNGTDSVAWTYTPPSPLANGNHRVEFEVVDSSSGNQTSSTVNFAESGNPMNISSVSPNHGPGDGGTPVTISGTGFDGATSVTFGSTVGTNFVVVNNTTITVTSPAGHAGAAVNVRVDNATQGTEDTLASSYTYNGPTVSSVKFVNGGAANTFDAGDQIVITFSEPMEPSSFHCGITGATTTGVSTQCLLGTGNGSIGEGSIGHFGSAPPPNSTVTAAFSGATLMLTVTATTSGTGPSGTLTANTAGGPSAATDLGGNALSGAPVSPSGSF